MIVYWKKKKFEGKEERERERGMKWNYLGKHSNITDKTARMAKNWKAATVLLPITATYSYNICLYKW